MKQPDSSTPADNPEGSNPDGQDFPTRDDPGSYHAFLPTDGPRGEVYQEQLRRIESRNITPEQKEYSRRQLERTHAFHTRNYDAYANVLIAEALNSSHPVHRIQQAVSAARRMREAHVSGDTVSAMLEQLTYELNLSSRPDWDIKNRLNHFAAYQGIAAPLVQSDQRTGSQGQAQSEQVPAQTVARREPRPDEGNDLSFAWADRARERGVPSSLASLGRMVMRRAIEENWSNNLKRECGVFDGGEAMIQLALAEPESTFARWRYLVDPETAQDIRNPFSGNASTASEHS
ncbi:MAG: hypothetical protein QF793_03175 [Candidatus Peribacteraceae bacterium]|nr:hypothetical protein [bacterium]MDP6561904.1 hypothetical protein [Candidatus Peribacteraceae bacterium]